MMTARGAFGGCRGCCRVDWASAAKVTASKIPAPRVIAARICWPLGGTAPGAVDIGPAAARSRGPPPAKPDQPGRRQNGPEVALALDYGCGHAFDHDIDAGG